MGRSFVHGWSFPDKPVLLQGTHNTAGTQHRPSAVLHSALPGRCQAVPPLEAIPGHEPQLCTSTKLSNLLQGIPGTTRAQHGSPAVLHSALTGRCQAVSTLQPVPGCGPQVPHGCSQAQKEQGLQLRHVCGREGMAPRGWAIIHA